MALVSTVPVYLEVGSRRVFAAACDWPGWCRSGKDEAQALEALSAAVPRYAAVAEAVATAFPTAQEAAFHVVERLPGSASTDFGAPGAVAAREREPLTEPEAGRLAALVAASWAVFDRIAAGAPAELRKGPRGGGRDRDAIVEHVLDSDLAYATKLGLRLRRQAPDDASAVTARRDAIAGALRMAAGNNSADDRRWPARYAARRIAWHALDHAWEIEDRS